MRPGLRNVLLFTIVSLALVVTGANFSKHQDVLTSIEQQQEEEQMQKTATTWVSEGLTHTLTTPRLEGEEIAAWAARHKEAVDAFKAQFPPDPAGG